MFEGLVRVASYKGCHHPGCLVVNATAKARTAWERGLSPGFIGPVDLYGGFSAVNLLNAWRFCQVYPIHVDDNGNLLDSYWSWAKHGWENVAAHPYPTGPDLKEYRNPLYVLWDGRKLDKISARKMVYGPGYITAARKTEGYQKILQAVRNGSSVLLRAFDGYDHDRLGMSLKEVLNAAERACSHVFYLKMALTDDQALDSMVWSVSQGL